MGTTKKSTIEVTGLSQEVLKLRLLGTTPLFTHRLPDRVAEELLLGGKSKTRAEKRSSIKHHPYQEFVESTYATEGGPTALGIPAMAIKAAMVEAAKAAGKEINGTDVNRLVFIPGKLFPLYGVPQLHLQVMKNKDMNRTPDIRTRAYFPRWGAEIEVRYTVPYIKASAVVTLLSNAGILAGIGDSRQQKGKGSFGSFTVLGAGDKNEEWNLVAKEGRAQQLDALNNPVAVDDFTARMLAAYDEAVKAAS